jgi:glycosyltransferase involved in cell wall biosynthesis
VDVFFYVSRQDMIVVNARFLTQSITGVQRYAIELSLRLKQLDSSIEFVCPENVVHHSIFEQLNAKIVGKRTGHLWEQTDLPRYLRIQGNPLLVNLESTAPVRYKNKIVTLHDITYIRYPQSFSLKFRVWYRLLIPRMLRKSLALVTVSDFSKKEILSYFKHLPKDIYVIYNAINEQFTTGQTISKDTSPYLLAVSSPNYHKNFARLINAFLNLHKSKKIKERLLIVGESNHSFTKQFYDEANNSTSIHFMGRIKDEKLIELYQNAEVFIFPSLYEGFGIPALEAQACGCPVIASNAASMPEVLEGSVIYFEPTNILEMQNTIEMVINKQYIRKSLMNKGFSNVCRFSWNESARKLYTIILKYS